MPHIKFASDTNGVASQSQGQILPNVVTANVENPDHELETSSSTGCTGVCSIGLEDQLISSMSELEVQIATRNTEERLLAVRLSTMKTFLDNPEATAAPWYLPLIIVV